MTVHSFYRRAALKFCNDLRAPSYLFYAQSLVGNNKQSAIRTLMFNRTIDFIVVRHANGV